MNTVAQKNQQILGEDYILVCVEAFLKERKSQNLAKGTIKYYKRNLLTFVEYLNNLEIKFISQITSNIIRDFLLILEERGHNPGGIHGHFRAVKVFLKWYWMEEEPDYSNPIDKVKSPKNPIEALEGISKENFETLVEECREDFLGIRDKTILYVLYDTGVRASELCNIKLEDINFLERSILIRMGKGRKPRFVFFGRKTKRQLKKYLRIRKDSPYLFTNRSGDKLIYSALRQMLRRLCIKADLKNISLHDFRRAFCLNCLNKGMAEITISRLMGHTTTQLIGRYAKQTTVDLQNMYKSIVDD